MTGLSSGILEAKALCSTCEAPLGGRGACFACLLRVGLEPEGEQEPLASAIFGEFEIARLEDGSWWELGRDDEAVNGKAIKCISMLLPRLPEKHGYKVIFMTRPIREVVDSQQRMTGHLATKAAGLDGEQLARGLESHRDECFSGSGPFRT